MDLLGGLNRLYGQFDKNVAQGYLPGGSERQKNATEMLISAAAAQPGARILRSGLEVAGKLMPETVGPIADSSKNAIRAITGDNVQVDPSSYSSGSRNQMANAIDRAIADAGAKDGQFVDVQYVDYGTGGDGLKNTGAYVAGAMNAKRNADGTYTIAPNERYDFNAAAQRGNTEYKANLDQATNDAFKRGDYTAVLANLPDHLAYHTGAGGKGFNIGGTFTRGNAPQPTAQLVQTRVTPVSNYAVQAGDTLSSIAAANDTTVADIVAKNKISNADLINVGQRLMF